MLKHLTRNRPARLIKLNRQPYLERLYIGSLFGVQVVLHRFLSCDGEQGVHNHPWRYGLSVVLRGGYVEERAFDLHPKRGALVRTRCVNWLSVVNGNTFHRIARIKPGTWTLFMHTRRDHAKGWGFVEPGYTNRGEPVAMFKGAPSSGDNWHESAEPAHVIRQREGY